MSESLRDEILLIRSKKGASNLISKILNHQVELEALMACFFSDDWVLCQKASWPVTILADQRPELLEPYLERMLDNLSRPNHDAVVRNTIRTWEVMDIPEDLEGPIYDRCFEYFIDPGNAVAIRVFSMTVCTNIAMKHPSLAEEIIPVIEDNWDHATAAWRSRGRKELKRLRKSVLSSRND